MNCQFAAEKVQMLHSRVRQLRAMAAVTPVEKYIFSTETSRAALDREITRRTQEALALLRQCAPATDRCAAAH